MIIYRKAEIFDDLFLPLITPSSIKYVEPPTAENIIIILYRGMDIDFDRVNLIDNKLRLSPSKSEQQSIWFSRYIEDAKGRGYYILEYPLNAIKHFERVHYEDGQVIGRIPSAIKEKQNELKDCQYHAGIELPDGWLWSYKTEKYIVCKTDLIVDRDMFQEDILSMPKVSDEV